MSVDCRIYLSPGTRVGDVAKVLGILDGLKPERLSLGGESWAAEVRGTGVKPSVVPECADIQWTNPNGTYRYQMWHFEAGVNGERLLMPRSLAWWIAAGKRLVDFFGGSIDFVDSDDVAVDYQAPPQPDIHAEDGEEWHALQARIMAVTPLTKKEIKAAVKFSAYGE